MQNSENHKGKLYLPHIVALYIGAVLGSGILILPGVAAEISGPASLLAWGLMAVLIVPMSLTIGLLSAKYPNAGGVSFFVKTAFNQNLGSLVGWYFTMAVLIGAPVICLTGAGYFCNAFGLSDTYRFIIAGVMLFFGVATNYFGMKVTGKIQIAVVLTTLIVLIFTIAGNFSQTESVNYEPFMPNGWGSVGSTLTILFWCFIGWEAVANFTAEFRNPKRDAVRGAMIASAVISVIYFFTAFVIVGTHSYGLNISDVSLIYLIKSSFGISGALVAGFAALFICIAPTIAYIGAIARLIFSLAKNGYAPKTLASVSKKYNTPLGGLIFQIICFGIVLIIFSTKIVSMAALLQIPNATFILTYLGVSAAGIKLLKDSKFGVLISLISLLLSVTIFLFVGWTVLYPSIITLFWAFFVWRKRRRTL